MYSKSLNGFYQSDIYLAAPDRETAIALAIKGFTDWMALQIEEFGYVFEIDPGDDPEDYNRAWDAKLAEFRAELETSLVPVPGNVTICRSV